MKFCILGNLRWLGYSKRMPKQGLRKEMMKKSVWGLGKDDACNHIAEGHLFIAMICKAYRKDERDAWWWWWWGMESQAYTHT